MLHQDVLGWVSWISFFVTVFGFVASIYGLFITYSQASQAKNAAQQASEKAQEALDVVRSRTRLAALSSAVSQLDAIRNLIESSDLQVSRFAFTSFRRLVQEAIAMFPPTSDELQNEKIAVVNRNLAKVAELMDGKIDVSGKTTMNKCIRTVSEFLIQEESKAKSELR